jgi:hypothetical protein
MAPQIITSSLRTKSTRAISPNKRIENGLIALPYEDTLPARPPIPVTVAPPRAPPTDTHPALRGGPAVSSGLEEKGESKRDSGLAPTTSSSKVCEGLVKYKYKDAIDENVLGFSINFNSTIVTSPRTFAETPAQVSTTPNTTKSESVHSSASKLRWKRPVLGKISLPKSPTNRANTSEKFSLITTPIPTDSLLDEEFLDQLSFSKRGSMMLGGQKAVEVQPRENVGRRWE